MKMNFKNMFKGFNVRQLEEGEVGIGLDGKTYFRREDGDYVRYDATTEQIINTHDMKFDFGMSMIIPSPTIVVGDIIAKDNDFIHITKITNNRIYGVGINTGRTKSIVKEVSALGINFYEKVVNMADNMFGGNIGGMNPMMFAMMEGSDNKDGDKNNMMQKMFEMQMMSQMFSAMQQGSQQPTGAPNMFMPMISNPIQQQQILVSSKTEVIEDENLSDKEIEAEIDRLMALKSAKSNTKETEESNGLGV